MVYELGRYGEYFTGQFLGVSGRGVDTGGVEGIERSLQRGVY